MYGFNPESSNPSEADEEARPTPIEVVEQTESGVVIKSTESNRLYGIEVSRVADGEEISVDELEELEKPSGPGLEALGVYGDFLVLKNKGSSEHWGVKVGQLEDGEIDLAVKRLYADELDELGVPAGWDHG
jgi:hypothetical protein